MSFEPKFIHLRVHTEYSLLEGAVPVKKLIGLCEKHAMPAVAVTDTNNMFAALEFSVLASGAGLQPIIGCQINLIYDIAAQGEKQRLGAFVVLLAQNEKGYRNLLKLNSALYLDKGGQLPQVTLADLALYQEGLICLSGGADGPVGRILQLGQEAKAHALMAELATIYPKRFYIELQRHHNGEGRPHPAEGLTERGFVEMAYAMDLPLVATNDVYFPDPKMYQAHDALICIAEGAYLDQQTPRRRLTPAHYFKSEAEMAALFADLPEALANTI